MKFDFEKIVPRNSKPIPESIAFRAPMLYKDKYPAICIESSKNTERIAVLGYINDHIKAVVLAPFKEKTKLIPIRDEFRKFKYNRESIINFCTFKLKGYEKSAKRFGFRNHKRKMYEDSLKPNAAPIVVTKITGYYNDDEDVLKFALELLNPYSGKNIKFVEEDLEIIYPSLGFKFPVIKSLSEGDIVKIIDSRIIPKGFEGTNNSWKIICTKNLNKDVITVINTVKRKKLKVFRKNIKKIKHKGEYEKRTDGLRAFSNFIRTGTTKLPSQVCPKKEGVYTIDSFIDRNSYYDSLRRVHSEESTSSSSSFWATGLDSLSNIHSTSSDEVASPFTFPSSPEASDIPHPLPSNLCEIRSFQYRSNPARTEEYITIYRKLNGFPDSYTTYLFGNYTGGIWRRTRNMWEPTGNILSSADVSTTLGISRSTFVQTRNNYRNRVESVQEFQDTSLLPNN